METKHTSGPWEWRANGIFAGSTKIADRHCQGIITAEEDQANASLISAAPDLLDACEQAIEALEWYRQETFKVGDKVIEMLKAAIHKATCTETMSEQFINDVNAAIDKGELVFKPSYKREWPESKMIAVTDYDPEFQHLFVTFKNGKKYTYYDVPESEVKFMNDSTSIGAYVNTKIKGQYSVEAADEPQALTSKSTMLNLPTNDL